MQVRAGGGGEGPGTNTLPAPRPVLGPNGLAKKTSQREGFKKETSEWDGGDGGRRVLYSFT